MSSSLITCYLTILRLNTVVKYGMLCCVVTVTVTYLIIGSQLLVILYGFSVQSCRILILASATYNVASQLQRILWACMKLFYSACYPSLVYIMPHMVGWYNQQLLICTLLSIPQQVVHYEHQVLFKVKNTSPHS